MTADNKVGVRTEVSFKEKDGSVNRYVLADYVDRNVLAGNLRAQAAVAKKDGRRPGEVVVISGSTISLSREKIAVISTLTLDGNLPMHPSSSSVRLISRQFPRKFGK